MKLSPTQIAILKQAAAHPHHLAEPPARLPAGARQSVARALCNGGLVEAIDPGDTELSPTWTVDGERVLLRITEAGLRAISVEPDERSDGAEPAASHGQAMSDASAMVPQGAAGTSGDSDPASFADSVQPLSTAPETPAAAKPRLTLRDAAADVLAAWDTTDRSAVAKPMEALRAALGPRRPARSARTSTTERRPREGTKQQAVLDLLRRHDGATIAQIIDATGWQSHTVRGFLAGLRKRGHVVSVLERVRQVGPGREGAKGSYSIYRIDPA